MGAGEPSARSIRERAAVHTALARHQQRREQGIPTLSVLVGAADDAVAVWQKWASFAGMSARVRLAPQEIDAETQPGQAVLFVCAESDETGLALLVERLWRVLDAPARNLAAAPLALAVGSAEAAAFLGEGPFCRARTLFAEGLVTLPTILAPSTDNLPEFVGGPPLGVPLRTETAASFKAAASALRIAAASSAEPAEHDRARSAAERFLFELLRDLPETAGLFELNVRLDFCFGPMRAEVDLLAAGLRLAVEIDGFHHFREPDAYRRDRRKDALLQRQGFLVLRFLAADVVERLEEILEEIRRTVAFRRATLPGA